MTAWVLCPVCGWQPEDCFFPKGESTFGCPYCESIFTSPVVQSETRPGKMDVPFASEEAAEGVSEE